ncbi:Holliday junction resolvase RuvX [Aureitalea marina]|uniref:Putative pre-16S rRNA nuclease n=1 Tax=Aureitalea marina TaxID=930804 RepID=A0A2S7KQ28_9FLAO|nr:Holliday junction resolvase RuvX [Aureitalea marina]PQB04720.1 Holliday junction DNA helicase RuvA [Aureitalea marina]
MARVLAIDYGRKRTGLAVTDPLQLIASGLTTVPTAELFAFVEEYIKQEEVELILVGEPKQRDGSASDIEERIAKFVRRLRQEIPQIPVERADERFTSKMAFQAMIDGGLRKKKRADKGLVDKVSATIILQDYLERKQ